MRNKIAVLRKGRFSQQELADIVGISRPYMSDIERNVNDPTAALASRICKALGESFERVFTDGPDEPREEVPANA